MPRRLTSEEFVRKAKAIHGNRYDYSAVNYVSTCTLCRRPAAVPVNSACISSRRRTSFAFARNVSMCSGTFANVCHSPLG